MTKRPCYFLACPYQGTDTEKTQRQKLSQKIALAFLKNKLTLFAPIVYNQALLDQDNSIDLEERRALLMPMNLDFLYRANALILLKCDGWDTSWGLKHYFEVCQNQNIPIYDLDPANLDQNLTDLLLTLQGSHP